MITDHDNKEGAAERKWKAIIAKSNYKKEDYISTKKCSVYYRYCNVYHFLQLQLHYRRS